MILVDPTYAVAGSAVEALLNSLWQGAVLALIAGILLRAMPRANAATRYGIWLATLLAIGFLPFFGIVLHVASSGSPDLITNQQPVGFLQPFSTRTQNINSPLSTDVEAHHESVRVSEKEVESSERTVVQNRHELPVRGTGTTQRLQVPELQLATKWWTLMLFLIWLFITAFKLSRVFRSYRFLEQLKLHHSPLSPKYQNRLRSLKTACRVNRQVRLGSSEEIALPVFVGLTRPIILVPKALLMGLTEAEIDQVMLHELAHVKRWDDWTNACQKLLEAIFWFNPAVIWIGRRLSLEREVACDQHVIYLTQEHKQYATCLTKLAEFINSSQRLTLATGAAAHKTQIYSRVALLLRNRSANPRLSRGRLLGWTAFLTGLCAICLMSLPLIKVRRQPDSTVQMNRAEAPGIGAGQEPQLVATCRIDQGPAHLPSEGVSAIEVGKPTEVDKPVYLKSNEKKRSLSTRPEMLPLLEKVNTTSSSAQATSLTGSSPEKVGANRLDEKNTMIESADDDLFRRGLRAVVSMDSPIDQHHALASLLNRKLSPDEQVEVLRASMRIASDEEKGSFLIEAAQVCSNDKAVLSVYLEAAATIASAQEKERALVMLLRREKVGSDILGRVIAMATDDLGSPKARARVMDTVMARLSNRNGNEGPMSLNSHR